MEAETCFKLLNDKTLVKEEIIEIVAEHVELFGNSYPFDPADRANVQFFANRVKAFYKGDKNIIETAEAYAKFKANNPPKKAKDLAFTTIKTKDEWEILVTEHNRLFGQNFIHSFEVDNVMRLQTKMQGYYNKDKDVIKHHKAFKDSLKVQSVWSTKELMSKAKTTEADELRIWEAYDKLFPEEPIKDKKLARNLRLAKFKCKYLL